MTARENQRTDTNRHFFRRGIDQMCSGCALLGNCDCLASTYIGISISFFFFGSVMMLSAERGDFLSKSELRPSCLIGFTFICTSFAVAIKSLLYLRRKTVILLLRRQAISMRVSSADALSQRPGSREGSPSSGFVVRNASSATLPPAYDDTLPGVETGENPSTFAPIDTPPPSYEAAVYLMSLKATMEAEMEKTGSAEAANKP